jgi:hypothetical protein
VAPGEAARIVHVLDAVEPRIKVGGDTVTFPGFWRGAHGGPPADARLAGSLSSSAGNCRSRPAVFSKFNEGVMT